MPKPVWGPSFARRKVLGPRRLLWCQSRPVAFGQSESPPSSKASWERAVRVCACLLPVAPRCLGSPCGWAPLGQRAGAPPLPHTPLTGRPRQSGPSDGAKRRRSLSRGLHVACFHQHMASAGRALGVGHSDTQESLLFCLRWKEGWEPDGRRWERALDSHRRPGGGVPNQALQTKALADPPRKRLGSSSGRGKGGVRLPLLSCGAMALALCQWEAGVSLEPPVNAQQGSRPLARAGRAGFANPMVGCFSAGLPCVWAYIGASWSKSWANLSVALAGPLAGARSQPLGISLSQLFQPWTIMAASFPFSSGRAVFGSAPPRVAGLLGV